MPTQTFMRQLKNSFLLFTLFMNFVKDAKKYLSDTLEGQTLHNL
jgi:hypothetical protein